ncbi:MAG: L-threonylcarbamoyladenylate synthase [Muribaculaceae bacterium]
MKILTIYPGSVNARHIAEAVERLRAGAIICFPTDTVYALGCDALNQRAIESLCRLKGINPDKNQLSVVCSGLSQASEYVRIDNAAYRIVKEYLPGPYTFVLPASTKLPKVFKGRKTVGLRIPDNDIAVALAEELGNPILTTSVEVGEEWDSTNAESLAMCYGSDVSIVVDGGDGGTVPSTVVDLTDPSDPQVIRQGLGDF